MESLKAIFAHEERYGVLRTGNRFIPSTVGRALRLKRKPISVNASSWREWVLELFPEKVGLDFAPHHEEIWSWATTVTHIITPRPLVAILPRAGGKTTTLDLMISFILATRRRNFILIVASNIFKARQRIKSVMGLLESPSFKKRYPETGEPALNEKGSVYGWNEDVLRMESGQIVAAASIAGNNRGLNEQTGQRPDMIVLDDIDSHEDSQLMTDKKEREIVSSILPTEGSLPAAVVFVQNLIKSQGVADRLVTGLAEWANDRILVGPIPAVWDLEYETEEETVTVNGNSVRKVRHKITEGKPSWTGQDLAACQYKVDKWGLSTFLHECQHVVINYAHALLETRHFRHAWEGFDMSILSPTRAVGVDPSGGAVECGIVCAGRDGLGQYYVLDDQSVPVTPHTDWADVAVHTAITWRARMIVETNYAGGLVLEAIKAAIKKAKDAGATYSPVVEPVQAYMSKQDRAFPVQKLYKDGKVIHLRSFERLETEWTTWEPGKSKESPNRLDAAVHAINALRALAQPVEDQSLPFEGYGSSLNL